jgi:hypothetical protein
MLGTSAAIGQVQPRVDAGKDRRMPQITRSANPKRNAWRGERAPASLAQMGPYVSERQWGTVREDYSADGDAWNYFPHDHARSRAYRWGEDGIGGFCDAKQQLCMAVALWNGKDPILKERMFGLSNREGNHGEDVKELYYYLDAVPTYSYARMLYKYPQADFPTTFCCRRTRGATGSSPSSRSSIPASSTPTAISTSISNMPRPAPTTSCCG